MVELRVFESCVWKKKKKLKKIMASQQQSTYATIFNRHGYEGELTITKLKMTVHFSQQHQQFKRNLPSSSPLY
jgi:hypothetical protein